VLYVRWLWESSTVCPVAMGEKYCIFSGYGRAVLVLWESSTVFSVAMGEQYCVFGGYGRAVLFVYVYCVLQRWIRSCWVARPLIPTKQPEWRDRVGAIGRNSANKRGGIAALGPFRERS
jgi:hypothetical protein